MPLDPWLASRLDALADVPEVWDMETESWASERWDEDPGPWVIPADVTHEDVSIPGPNGPVPLRTYLSAGRREGVLVWLHGGGFAYGGLDQREAHVVSAELSARTGWEVVSVDYRLATGGVRFPVPLEDSLAAVNWAAERASDTVPLAMGGASAGTTLTLSAALTLRDASDLRLDRLLLAYPFAHQPVPDLDPALEAELDLLPTSLRLGPRVMDMIVENYVGRLTDLPPLAVPGYLDLRELPPTSILVSEYDDLRPSGELLARQLDGAGVPVEFYLASGMLHGHLDRLPSLPEVDRSIDFFARALSSTTSRRMTDE